MNGIILDAIVLVLGSKTVIAVIASVAIGLTMISTIINVWKSFSD